MTAVCVTVLLTLQIVMKTVLYRYIVLYDSYLISVYDPPIFTFTDKLHSLVNKQSPHLHLFCSQLTSTLLQ